MNSKGFNQFKSFVNQGGSSSGGKSFVPLVLGFGLLWLAQSSIYYGIIYILFQLMSGTMPSSLISYGVD